MSELLSGLKILVLEDEFLIAMDVEQLCRDHGAEEVTISRTLAGLELAAMPAFDAAIIDVMLSGVPTFGFATHLQERGVPFVFASGYADQGELSKKFPGTRLIGKPYSGDDLVNAIAAACGRDPSGSV